MEEYLFSTGGLIKLNQELSGSLKYGHGERGNNFGVRCRVRSSRSIFMRPQRALARNAIRAIVTHRTKQAKRLEAKLKERVAKLRKAYNRPADIRDDIVDLAGVRIALHFPSDSEKVAKIIEDACDIVKRVRFPDPDNTSSRGQDGTARNQETNSVLKERTGPHYEQRFSGYLADHYCVKMKLEIWPHRNLEMISDAPSR